MVKFFGRLLFIASLICFFSCTGPDETTRRVSGLEQKIMKDAMVSLMSYPKLGDSYLPKNKQVMIHKGEKPCGENTLLWLVTDFGSGPGKGANGKLDQDDMLVVQLLGPQRQRNASFISYGGSGNLEMAFVEGKGGYYDAKTRIPQSILEIYEGFLRDISE